MEVHHKAEPWEAHLGYCETSTGGRLKRVRDYVRDETCFNMVMSC